MIGPLLALALQATAPADAPAHNAADSIDDILNRAPSDRPPPAPPVPAAAAPAVAAPNPTPPPQATTASPPSAPSVPQAPIPYQSRYDDGPDRYASGVRSNFQAREARQGDLDGRWTLSDPDGKGLYVFQFADPGPGRGPVEGAWRDLARQGAPNASGFLDAADRTGSALSLSFEETGRLTITLIQGADGRWTGVIHDADRTKPVIMTKS